MTETTRVVHPVAALFPMLSAEDLKALAADIKKRGLLHPIVLDTEGRILDGRNRAAACDLAGIEPGYTEYEGKDPAGYALAANLNRRDLTKGQKAMVVAQTEYKNYTGLVSKQYVSWATQVKESAGDLVDSVIAGAIPLSEAYAEAQKRKQAAQSDEARMAELVESAKDLADLVTEERMSLKEAYETWKKREKEQADNRRDSTALLNRIIGLTVPNGADPERFVADWAPHIVLSEIDRDRLDKTIHTLTSLKEALWTSQNT